ncbi:unnamed protein product, partial [Brassica rapa subsp. narinosa]
YLPDLDSLKILSPLLTKKQAHRRFRRGGVELLFIEEKIVNPHLLSQSIENPI